MVGLHPAGGAVNILGGLHRGGGKGIGHQLPGAGKKLHPQARDIRQGGAEKRGGILQLRPLKLRAARVAEALHQVYLAHVAFAGEKAHLGAAHHPKDGARGGGAEKQQDGQEEQKIQADNAQLQPFLNHFSGPSKR